MTKIKLLTALAIGLTATMAAATDYKFAYAASTGTLSGRFTGTLQSDLNTILVDAVGYGRFDGIGGVAVPVLTTGSSLYGTPRAPRATLDGSLLDFAACSDADCSDGFLFDPDVVEFAPVISTGTSYGSIRELTTPGLWSITAVPEPATWSMMLLGFGVVGTFARRRIPRVTA